MGTMFSRIYTSKIASLSGVYHSERLSRYLGGKRRMKDILVFFS